VGRSNDDDDDGMSGPCSTHEAVRNACNSLLGGVSV
jgi:hypothetical protein